MAVRHGPVRWVVLLAVALVVAGAALVVWWPGASNPAEQGRRASATVVSAASCQGANAFDTVEVSVDGQKKRARLNGCGHHEGEVIDVQVPDGAGDDMLVEPAGAAPAGSGMTRRLSVLLVSIAALAGAGYAHLLRRRPGTPLIPAVGRSRVGAR